MARLFSLLNCYVYLLFVYVYFLLIASSVPCVCAVFELLLMYWML